MWGIADLQNTLLRKNKMVANVSGRPHPYGEGFQPKKNWGCGNTNKEILCRSVDCIDCEGIRTRLRVGLPEVTNIPPMPPCKPPKAPCSFNGEEEIYTRIANEHAETCLQKPIEPLSEKENLKKIEDLKIWLEGFCSGCMGNSGLSEPQWELLQKKLSEILYGKQANV